MFIVLWSWQSHCKSLLGSSDEYRTVPAADLWIKPTGLSHKPTYKITNSKPYPPSPFIILLSLNAETHFTVPQRVEGRVNLGGLLHTKMA